MKKCIRVSLVLLVQSSRDIPPSPDLGADTTGSFNRGLKRPKGNVSYTEPNLRDKIRRPTRDPIDTVSGRREEGPDFPEVANGIFAEREKTIGGRFVMGVRSNEI